MGTSLQAQLLRDADLCVKCGLCLPHCPTYRLTLDEGESPRGRIALLQNWTQGTIGLTRSMETHLDNCLACGACEPVCPAHVPYGRILDQGRERMAEARPLRTWGMRLLAPWLTVPSLRGALMALLRLYQGLGISRLIRRFQLLGKGALARLESLLPDLPARRRIEFQRETCAEVGLFLGCTGAALEPELAQAAQSLLERCGYRVGIPQGQACCGALHQHAGLARTAQRLRRRTADAFHGCETLTGLASGCVRELAHAAEFAPSKVRDIQELVAARLDRLHFKPLRARMALHTPCTQSPGWRALLSQIPGLDVVDLDSRFACCGAAGSYFLTRPSTADALLEPKLQAAQALKPEVILSSNIGCSLHLAAGLRRAGITTPVRHPLAVLAQQAVAAP